MTDQTAEQVLGQIRAQKSLPAAVEGDVQEDALNIDGFADLDSVFDDHLRLPIRGRIYAIPPASAELGLLCTRLVMAGTQVAQRGRVTSGTKAQLDDDEEVDLYQRLLGHTPYLTAGTPEVLCDGGEPLGEGEGVCEGGEVLTAEVPPEPNPAYEPDEDVWQQLWDDGMDWQRIQHVGTTAMIWTAVGKPAAQSFWVSGARPKASATPAPRAPEDRRPKASGKSGRPGSTAGTTSQHRKKAGTAGT